MSSILHEINEASAVLLAHRREADAAIAEEDCHHAMPPRPGLATDLGNAIAINRHIARELGCTGAVEDGATANDDVVHLASLA
jgi:hypothetical protein